jgi:hypothetical protein
MYLLVIVKLGKSQKEYMGLIRTHLFNIAKRLERFPTDVSTQQKGDNYMYVCIYICIYKMIIRHIHACLYI